LISKQQLFFEIVLVFERKNENPLTLLFTGEIDVFCNNGEEKMKKPVNTVFRAIRHRFAMRIVGMTGFEPAASSSRTKRATGLRYIPLKSEH
jgi:hypothetical protein